MRGSVFVRPEHVLGLLSLALYDYFRNELYLTACERHPAWANRSAATDAVDRGSLRRRSDCEETCASFPCCRRRRWSRSRRRRQACLRAEFTSPPSNGHVSDDTASLRDPNLNAPGYLLRDN